MSAPRGDVAEFYERLWQTPDADSENAARWSFQSQLVERALSRLGDLSGKTVLEIGPGAGREAAWMVASGARTVTLDLAQASLLRTREATSDAAFVVQARAEELPFPDACVDRIFTQTTLMHLDRPRAAAEWVRVLRPGGRVVVLEPTAGNPIVGLYRRFVSPYKVTAPRYVTVAELGRLSPRLELVRHEPHFLLSILALVVPAALSGPVHRLLTPLDRLLLRAAPLGRFAWMTLAELKLK